MEHGVQPILISSPEFNLPPIGSFKWLTTPGSHRATTCQGRELISDDLSGEGINLWITYILLTTQGHGGPPRIRVQLNAGATSETAQTWKTIHTRHTLGHSNKANMKLWLWWPDDFRGAFVTEPILTPQINKEIDLIMNHVPKLSLYQSSDPVFWVSLWINLKLHISLLISWLSSLQTATYFLKKFFTTY